MQMQHNTQKNKNSERCLSRRHASATKKHAVIALPTTLRSHSIAGCKEAIPVNTATQKKRPMAVHEA